MDIDALRSFARPSIKQARMQLENERAAFQEALGKPVADRLISQYDQVPDEDKPFYSMRIAFYVADAERQKRIKAEFEANIRTQAKALTEKERQDYEKLKQKRAEKKRADEKRRKRKKNSNKKHR